MTVEEYVALVVDGDGTEEYPGAPALDEAPPEAEQAIRALGNHHRNTSTPDRRAS